MVVVGDFVVGVWGDVVVDADFASTVNRQPTISWD